MPLWLAIILIAAGILGGAAAGIFMLRRTYTQQTLDNPPISEDFIRNVFAQAGRKASEVQIQQTLRQYKAQYKAAYQNRKKK
ncbi:MAG: YneF family protein [Streptococcaceae bacterium]|jgi:uncharacterized protein YneF (UPF0154 family)|nr:YneF family protein [Streptococcaceae bacterium]